MLRLEVRGCGTTTTVAIRPQRVNRFIQGVFNNSDLDAQLPRCEIILFVLFIRNKSIYMCVCVLTYISDG
jgi:hypothetical protein